MTGLLLIQVACVKPDEKKMLDIDKLKENIKNNLSSLKMVEKYKDRFCYRNAYFNNNDLQLITVCFKDRQIDKNVEWYFIKGQLIYSEQTWTIREAKQVINNEKFYINDRHLIAWLKTDNKPVDKTSQEFKVFESKLVEYGDELIKDNK